MTIARISVVVLLVLACLVWLVLVALAATLNSSDPAGNAMSYSFAMLMTVALWVVLAVLLLVSGFDGAMPRRVGLSALVLVPLSGAAAMAAVNLLEGRADLTAKWPIILLVLVPFLLMFYAGWSFFPAWRSVVPPNAANIAVWSVVLFLSLLPWPALRSRATRDANAQANTGLQEQREKELARAENVVAFQRLTPESPLQDWLAFVTNGNELRDSAFAGIRRLARRQADAETLISQGDDLPMMELRNLDLEITPRFCGIAVEFLRKDADSFRPTTAAARYDVVSYRIERHLLTMRWLAANECDCAAAVSAYETTARLYEDSPERARFLAALAKVRGGT